MLHIEKKSILITVFEGTSSKLLLEGFKDLPVLVLPNDKVRDSQLLKENKLETKMVFIHIPFVKNIGEFKKFRNQILAVIKRL